MYGRPEFFRWVSAHNSVIKCCTVTKSDEIKYNLLPHRTIFMYILDCYYTLIGFEIFPNIWSERKVKGNIYLRYFWVFQVYLNTPDRYNQYIPRIPADLLFDDSSSDDRQKTIGNKMFF